MLTGVKDPDVLYEAFMTIALCKLNCTREVKHERITDAFKKMVNDFCSLALKHLKKARKAEEEKRKRLERELMICKDKDDDQEFFDSIEPMKKVKLSKKSSPVKRM